MTTLRIVSHHLLRRRARAKAAHLERTTHRDYTVTKAQRGPWRWYVIELD